MFPCQRSHDGRPPQRGTALRGRAQGPGGRERPGRWAQVLEAHGPAWIGLAHRVGRVVHAAGHRNAGSLGLPLY